MAGFSLASLTTAQKAIGALAIGGVGLVVLTSSGKKKAGAGGGLAVLDVRRPTDDINALGAGATGGVVPRLNQVLNIAPIFPGNPAYSGVYPGTTPPVIPPPVPPVLPTVPGPPGTTVPPTTQPATDGKSVAARIAHKTQRLARLQGRLALPGTNKDRLYGGLIRETERALARLNPKLREGSGGSGGAVTPPVGGGNGNLLPEKQRGNLPFIFMGGSIIEGDNEGYNLPPATNTAAISGAAGNIW